MKLAIHTATIADELRSGRLDVFQFARDAARLGCRAVEVDSSWGEMTDAFRAATAAAGLERIYASDLRLPSDADDRGDADAILGTAVALGAHDVTILPPRGATRWDFARTAAAQGIRLHVINEPTPGSVLHVRQVVDQAESPSVSAAFDTAAPALAGEDPVRSLYVLNRRVGHIHLSDAKPYLGRLRVTYPGDGSLWWYGIMWAFWSLGYQGYVTITFPGDGAGERCLGEAVQHFNRLRESRFAGSVP